ncbi:MAG: TetR family transcriptional regulator C-terminal domain-containing protein [Spirochaetes bacterium]|nr:TetR family transcriptional regulator C-terminal domain-containing protein [Spirochaetota bacterium]
MEDRRAAKSKMAIKKVFLELLKKKPLNKITVAELSREADLGRGTFYLHYNDIYDLYDYIESELYGGLIEIFEEQPYPVTNADDLVKLAEIITKYTADNKEVFLLVTGSGSYGKLVRKLKKVLREKMFQKGYAGKISKYDEMEYLFIMYGLIGILEDWLNTGLAMPRKELVKILHKILMMFY